MSHLKILAFLQNQWFENPERAEALYARWGPEKRHKLNAMLLAASPTGRRLERSFGDLYGEILWDEASLVRSARPNVRVKADPEHMARVLVAERPKVVLLFGAVAQDGWGPTLSIAGPLLGGYEMIMLRGPHPVARGKDTRPELDAMAASVRGMRLDAERRAVPA
jgi:hypothetical protein